MSRLLFAAAFAAVVWAIGWWVTWLAEGDDE